MPRLALSFLGTFQVSLDGQPVHNFRVNAARALLAYLAVEADRPHRRETLAGLLWPDVPDATALTHLRHTLSDLRKAIGDDDHASFLHITRGAIQFNLDRSASAWLDVTAFQRGAQSNTVTELEETVALYRGQFLAGFSLEGSPAFEEWLLVRQQQLAQLAVDALYRVAQHRAECGDYRLSHAHVQRLLTIEPWDERAMHLQLQLFALDGRRSEALAHYEQYRRQLAQELGAAPSLELAAEYDRLRAGQRPTALPSELPEDAPPTSAFVARERELARLERALVRAQHGQGHIVFVAGEAGSGKTALLDEFVRRALNSHGDVIALSGVCSAHIGSGDPYLPFRDILRLLTGDIEAKRASGALSPEHARRLWDALPDALQAVVEHGPDLIGSFVNGETLALRAEALTPARAPWRTRLIELARRPVKAQPSNMREQIEAILSAIARSHTLVLIIDDAQWADDETIGLLFHLRRLSTARLLIACAYRPDDVALGRNGQRHPLESIINELQRVTGEAPINLDAAEGRAFIDALLDAAPNRLDLKFRDTLYQRTSGHALFTVELISDLQSRGDLVRDATGHWTAGDTLDWRRLPARVEAVIAEHVGRVPTQWQVLLQAACVEGGEFTAGVVADAIGLAEAEVVRALSGELSQQYQLVTATRVDRIGAQRLLRYRFRHVLFETYLYQRQDAVTRTRLHEAIGTALEKRYADRPGDLSEIALQLARQFEGAGLKLRAARYQLIAGQHAARLSAYQEASRLLTHSLKLLADVPDSLERAQLETNVQLALGAVLLGQGWGTSDRARAFDRALELAQQTGATTELLYALHSLIDLAQGRGETAKAVALSHELLRLAEQAGQPALLALAHYSLGSSLFIAGHISSARAQLDQALALSDCAERTHEPRTGADVMLGTLAWSILAAWWMGDNAAAEAHAEQVLRRAQQIDHVFSLGIALVLGVCQYRLWQGRPAEDQARHCIDQLCQLAQGGVPMFRAWANVFDGYWRARRGEADGIAQLRQGIDEWAVAESRSGYVYQRLLLIEVYLRVDEIAAAQQAVDEALAFIEQSGNRMYEAELHRLRGEVAVARGERAEAQAHFRRAIEIADAQSAITWRQRAEQSLAALYEKDDRNQRPSRTRRAAANQPRSLVEDAAKSGRK